MKVRERALLTMSITIGLLFLGMVIELLWNVVFMRFGTWFWMLAFYALYVVVVVPFTDDAILDEPSDKSR